MFQLCSGICMFSGADPTLENEQGHRPVLYAKSPRIKEILASAEKKVKIGAITGIIPLLISSIHSNFTAKDHVSRIQYRASDGLTHYWWRPGVHSIGTRLEAFCIVLDQDIVYLGLYLLICRVVHLWDSSLLGRNCFVLSYLYRNLTNVCGYVQNHLIGKTIPWWLC